MKNLRHELRTAIMDSFEEGMDKHSIKKAGQDYGKIFSYSARNKMLDLANDFSKWLKGQGINRLENVTQNDVQHYLEHKSEICSSKTMSTYRTYLKKMGECVSVRHGLSADWSTDPVAGAKFKAPDRGAGDIISKEDFNKLIKYALEHPSSSGLVVLLETSLGGRVNDICRGITIQDGKAYMVGKGGKKYEPRKLNHRIMRLLESGQYDKWVLKQADGTLKFDFPKGSSVNKYLSRTEEKLGIEKHSFHALRRFTAQQKYDKCIAEGKTKYEALQSVSAWLNHGKDRKGVETFLKQHYITV